MFGAIHSPEAKSQSEPICTPVTSYGLALKLVIWRQRVRESESEKQVPSGILSFSCYRCSLVIKDNVILKGVSLKCKKGIEKTKN